jgi:hypothetical protein
MEIQNEMSEPHTVGNDATSMTPHIVNGLTVRPREKVRLWRILGISFGVFVPEVVIAIFGVRRILRYLDSRGGDAT